MIDPTNRGWPMNDPIRVDWPDEVLAAVETIFEFSNWRACHCGQPTAVMVLSTSVDQWYVEPLCQDCSDANSIDGPYCALCDDGLCDECRTVAELERGLR